MQKKSELHEDGKSSIVELKLVRGIVQVAAMEQKLGGSLPVPIVQELAKEKLATVPPRYVRPDQHQQTILSNSLSSFPQIPVIDMQNLSDEYSMDSELEALNHACQEWGFFQLINHGVESSVVEKMKLEVQEFFNLPIEEKNKFMQKAEDIEGRVQSMRMNYYPPCPQPELVTGLCPHSDAVGLTILLQANEMEGLQIKKDGVWIPVSPLPNAFVINIGDILEEHRASRLSNSTKERLSIATFLSPNDHAHLGPAASLVTPQTPAKFKTIGVAEYSRD
ncbi:UNVERIFIED_CONTAM: protein SRG1 [Sesamum calycinum]|uniref:Protein SRG1 n=1 Tax=Sesamum calycinum TaxID=2727403 RepID=A0AAW2MD86_9LAMI